MGVIEDAQAQAATNAAADAAANVAGSTAEATTVRSSVETSAATNELTKAESGKIIILDHATEFATTLPAPAAGLEFEFIVGNAPEAASYTVVTNGSANIMRGHILTADVNAASDGDFEAAGGDTLTFVDAKAVIGDRARFVSDGTYWYVQAACSVFDAITITTAS